MWRSACILAAILFAFPAAVLADPTITLPQTVTGAPGAFVSVPATTSGAVVKWFAVDTGLNLFPVNLLKDTRTAVVTSPTVGTYRLMAWTADQSGPSDAAVCQVQIGTPTPPVPPAPTDPLGVALQAAFAADTGTAKASELQLVQALLPLMAAKLQIAANYTTAGDFYADLNARRLLMGIPATDFAAEWAVITSDLTAKWPATQTLDASTRSVLGAEINHIASALGSIQVKK